MMDRVGYASVIYAYEDEEWGLTTLDGHLRSEELPDDYQVDVAILDFTREQAREFLASVDPMAMLSVPDVARVEGLFADLLPVDEVFAQLMAKIAAVDVEGEMPGFIPVGEDEQGRLDQIEPMMVRCPDCGSEFDGKQNATEA